MSWHETPCSDWNTFHFECFQLYTIHYFVLFTIFRWFRNETNNAVCSVYINYFHVAVSAFNIHVIVILRKDPRVTKIKACHFLWICFKLITSHMRLDVRFWDGQLLSYKCNFLYFNSFLSFTSFQTAECLITFWIGVRDNWANNWSINFRRNSFALL